MRFRQLTSLKLNKMPQWTRLTVSGREYRKAIDADCLEPKHGDWYVKRAQQFAARTRKVRLREKTAEDLRAYLSQTDTRWSRGYGSTGSLVTVSGTVGASVSTPIVALVTAIWRATVFDSRRS
jgi:hypothetical protein